ncbi:MAG: hypothetical protein K0R33_1034 [Mycobacterium sp.]|nr:hypothetical protein [Mycobacterium sp.]
MSRHTNALLDRAAALGAGLLLTAVGIAAVVWPTRWVGGLPERISAEPVVRATDAGWWPWALAAAGVLLTLTALIWLISHIPVRRSPMLRSSGTDRGHIRVSLDGVASAAAEIVARSAVVASAKGRAMTDSGVSTVELTVTVSGPTAVTEVIPVIDAVTAQIAQATGDPEVAARTFVQVAKSAEQRRRVE